jgi:hypothetical protein
MRFTIRGLMILIAVACAILASYKHGYDRGNTTGFRIGYTHAREREQAILQGWARAGDGRYGYGHWDDLGKWLREGRVDIIKREPWNDK